MFKKYFFPHDHKPEHIKSLDGLRGLAALIVIAAHGSEYDLNFHPYLNFSYYGKIGVYIFFILSAYLLDIQIIQVLRKNKSNFRYWANYFFRRFFRIFPMLFISLVLYYLMNRKYVGTFIESFEDILAHLTLQNGEFMYWSIPVEFKYYFISPLIILICHFLFKWELKKVVAFFIGLIVMSGFLEFYFKLSWISTIRSLPAFLIGSLIAVLQNFKPEVFSKKIQSIGSFSIIIVILSVPFYFEMLFGIPWAVNKPEAIMPYSALLGLAFIKIRFGSSLIQKIMETKFFRFFGKISYSLYLLHFAAILFLNKYGFENIFVNSIAFYLLSVLLSTGTYLFIEYPLSLISIKKRRKHYFKVETRAS